MKQTLDPWRADFRLLAAHIPTCGLEALRLALLTDDDRLVQCVTVLPDPEALENPAEGSEEATGGCGLALPWLVAMRQATGRAPMVMEVVAAFQATLDAVEAETRIPGKGADFLCAYDAWDRATMRRRLLPEVSAILARRAEVEAAAR